MAIKKRLLFLFAFTLAVPLLPANAVQQQSTDFVNAARSQIGKTVHYDPTYYTLGYPNGDIPLQVGVCTDVVIRALRASRQMDLQKLVHDDMQRAFTHYPKNWGLKGTDKNIDHRRVLNLQTYFKRKGYELPISTTPTNYQAGDIVTVLLPANLPHIMIVSDKQTANNTPLIIHNIGDGAQEEARLFEFKITGHYRIKP